MPIQKKTENLVNLVKDMFKVRREALQNHHCVCKPYGCGKKIDLENGFRDVLSRHEYTLSAMCQECQDDFFKEGEELAEDADREMGIENFDGDVGNH